jgi:hypothetical protein
VAAWQGFNSISDLCNVLFILIHIYNYKTSYLSTDEVLTFEIDIEWIRVLSKYPQPIIISIQLLTKTVVR